MSYKGPYPDRPVQWHNPQQEFQGEVKQARKASGYDADGQQPGLATAWDLLVRGQQLGKSVNIARSAGGFVANTGRSSQGIEILRIQPKTNGQNQYTVQGIVTLSPPQFQPTTNFPADLTQGINVADSINLEQAGVQSFGGNAGGQVSATGPAMRYTNLVAVVQWGIGSIMNRVECDMLNGLCLNLTFSVLIVNALLEQSLGDTQGIYSLGANVGPGFAKPNNAQRSLNLGGIANGASSPVFTIPRMAKSVRVATTDGTGTLGLGVIRFFSDNAGSGLDSLGDFTFTANNPIEIPIPSGAFFFTIVGGYASAGGAPLGSPNYLAIFDLAI